MRRVIGVRLVGSVLGALAAAVCAPAEASVTVNFNQVGGNVVATTTGSFDPTGLTALGTGGYIAGVNATFPAFDSTASDAGAAFSGLTGPGSFGAGTGGPFSQATSYTGDFFGFGANQVRLANGYIAGSAISAVTTFTGATFASLGLTPGTYNYTAPKDSFSINIGAVSGVPEPTTWAMMLIGFGGIGFSMRRKRKLEGALRLA